MARRPTIRDVAAAAGVSVTTVSDTVNGKGRVDPTTQARVMKAVSEVGWRPRRSAQSLRSGRNDTIALCLPRRQGSPGSWLMNSDYYMEITAACAAAAMDAEFLLTLAPSPRTRDEVIRLDVGGAIAVDPSENDQTLQLLDESGIAVVSVDRDLARSDMWWVGADNRGSATMLLEHLADGGASSVALLTSGERWAWFDDAHAAYTKWCDHRGVAPVVRHVDLDAPGPSAEVVFGDLLDSGERPDAVLALPYGAALGVIRAAHARQLRVPDDLLVAGGVDGHALETSTPPVTAADLRPVEVARTAVDLLRRRLDGEQVAGPVITEPGLRIRASSQR